MHTPQSTTIKKETIVIGLCFMQRKLKAKRNKEVYERLKCKEISLVQLWPYFHSHWSTWPTVDVLFQSHTADFPYIMVYEYVQYHKPMLINDLESEQLLWDRTVTYQALKEIDVPVPRYFPLSLHSNHVDRIQKESYGKILAENGETINYEEYIRNTKTPPNLFRNLYKSEQKKFQHQEFTEIQNSLLIKSQGQQIKINKPFIEKPSDSNNHKVSLYYPEHLGGGRRVLYREDHGHTSSAESQYQSQENHIRKDQNYIYEEFIGTNVFDIKVYTVGQFIFAETRRSPIVDVQKDCQNSELRHQVELTPEERQYCRRVVQKFKFPICGLDILRSDDKSYVCDINGWAFAKGGTLNQSVKIYWDSLAHLLKNMVFQKFFPEKAQYLSIQTFKDYKHKFLKQVQTTVPILSEQLKTVVQIISSKLAKNSQNMAKIGEQIRKKSYDGLDCLGLYSKFENLLKLQCFSNEIDIMMIGYLLKGYLGLRGELSPALFSMIKMNNSYEKNTQKLIEDILGLQKGVNIDKKVTMKTFIYVVNEETLEQLETLLEKRQKSIEQIGVQINQKRHASRIQLKIYKRNNSSEQYECPEEINLVQRVQTRFFDGTEVQRGQRQKMVRQLNFDQNQLINLLDK